MSKGLEKLALIQKVFEKLAEWNAYDLSKLDKDYETNFDLDFLEIEKELKEKEKQDKVIMIIQTKGVDILDLRVCTFSRYNQHRSLEGSFCLTKKEYDLLKEVML